MTNPSSDYSSTELLDILKSISSEYSNFDKHELAELVLMPLDPNWLHAYWNITEDLISLVGSENHISTSRFLLRIYGIGKSFEKTKNGVCFEVDVQGMRNQRNICLPQDDCNYFAELGYCDDSGFRVLLESNIISVPGIISRQCVVQESMLKDCLEEHEIPKGVDLDEAGKCVYWDGDQIEANIQRRLREHTPSAIVNNFLCSNLPVSSFGHFS
jgi:hypothetical protein